LGKENFFIIKVENFKQHNYITMKKLFVFSLLLILFMLSVRYVIAQSDESSKLYVIVIEQVDDPAMIITNAKVSLSYGSLGGEQSQPSAWQDISTQNGQAVFSGLADGYTYTVSAKAPGYFPAQKEFKKLTGVTGHISVVLTKAPEGAVGSVRVAVLVQAPQSPIALTTAKIDIFKADKFITSADTKNTKGKEGVVFSKLTIGENYEARITAPGYQSQQKGFAIEPNKETWLPILMDIVREKPATCPKDCKCDEQNNVLYCSGTGQTTEKGVLMTVEVASQKALEAAKLDSIQEARQKEVDGKPVYEIIGTARGRFLFVFPVSFSVKILVDAKTGSIEKTERPWWSFLVRK
jgi:hypothetical protein